MISLMDKCCGTSATELLSLSLSHFIWIFDCQGFKFSRKPLDDFASLVMTGQRKVGDSFLVFFSTCFFMFMLSFYTFSEFIFFQSLAFPITVSRTNSNVWSKVLDKSFFWRLNCNETRYRLIVVHWKHMVFQVRTVISQVSKFSAADIQDEMRCGLKALR